LTSIEFLGAPGRLACWTANNGDHCEVRAAAHFVVRMWGSENRPGRLAQHFTTGGARAAHRIIRADGADVCPAAGVVNATSYRHGPSRSARFRTKKRNVSRDKGFCDAYGVTLIKMAARLQVLNTTNRQGRPAPSLRSLTWP